MNTVTINMSAGKATASVPNLVGRPYDEDSIKALLSKSGSVLLLLFHPERPRDLARRRRSNPPGATARTDGES